jgi:hypothetical protein
MTRATLQGIIDCVYKQVPISGKLAPTDYKVTEDRPWWGLVSYRYSAHYIYLAPCEAGYRSTD